MSVTDIVGEVALEAGDFLGETPVWSVAEQALYWVNCESRRSSAAGIRKRGR